MIYPSRLFIRLLIVKSLVAVSPSLLVLHDVGKHTTKALYIIHSCRLYDLECCCCFLIVVSSFIMLNGGTAP